MTSRLKKFFDTARTVAELIEPAIDIVGPALEDTMRLLKENNEKAHVRATTTSEPAPADDLERHLEILGVTGSVTLADLRRAYKKKLATHHPDRFAGDPRVQRAKTDLTRRLTEAYEYVKRHIERRDGGVS